MTILFFFLSFSYLSLFLYDDIGRGQLNMQLNKSDDDDDDGGNGGEEEEEEEEDKEERGGVTGRGVFAGCEETFCFSDNDGK